jgi:hypothetical protein
MDNNKLSSLLSFDEDSSNNILMCGLSDSAKFANLSSINISTITVSYPFIGLMGP